MIKITFELTDTAAAAAASNAGASSADEIKLVSMGIQRASIIKIAVRDSEQYKVLSDQQDAGYRVIKIEA